MSDTVAHPPRTRAATRQAWTERFARFPTANQTIALFCATEGVSVASFYLWRRRLTAATPALVEPPPLLPVQVLAPPASVEFVLPSGTVLRVRPDTDPATVAPWLRLLGITPC